MYSRLVDLLDKLNTLLRESDEFQQQMNIIQSNLLALSTQNEELLIENAMLKDTLSMSPMTPKDPSEDAYRELEYKLAETRSRLARLQQSQEDQLLAREVVEKELEMEKSRRISAEKERDAYIAAYEDSLMHIEKFSRAKLLMK